MRVIGLMILLAVGCSSATGVENELEIRTSQAAIEIGTPIETRLVNHTDAVIYVSHCNHRVSLLLERRVGGVWQQHLQVNGPMCQAIYPSGELGIEPGDHVAETVRIEEAGEFRFLLYARRASEDFGSLVSVSRPFTVRHPPD